MLSTITTTLLTEDCIIFSFFISSNTSFLFKKSLLDELSKSCTFSPTNMKVNYKEGTKKFVGGWVILMGLYHPLDCITNVKYKLLYFSTPNKKISKRKALAFNRDRCCHLAICLWLILFHYRITDNYLKLPLGFPMLTIGA